MQVHLPKVKLQYRQELQEALTSMGERTEGSESHFGMDVDTHPNIQTDPKELKS